MSDCNGFDAPSTTTLVGIDVNGDPFSETLQNNSFVGMLIFISANTCPDIAYAVHPAARFSHTLCYSYATSVSCILHFLQKTKAIGPKLKPAYKKMLLIVMLMQILWVSLLLKTIKIQFLSNLVQDMLYCTRAVHSSRYPNCRLKLHGLQWKQNMKHSSKQCGIIPICEILNEVMAIVFEMKPTIDFHTHSKAFSDVAEGTVPYAIDQSTIYKYIQACLKFACMAKLSPHTEHIGIPG